MMRQTVRLLTIALLISVATLASTSAFAETGHATSRETGPVIRHQLLYRSTRVELSPFLGMTVGDAYLRNGLVGASLSYHLTNSWGLSAVGGFGVTQFDTDLRTNLESKLGQQRLQNLSYSYLQWLAGLEIAWVPIVGKFSIFNSAITNYDIHIMGGFSFVGQAAQAATSNGTTDPELEGLRPAPSLGLGMRLFLSDGISANLDVRDYLFSRAEVSSLTASPEFKNNVLVSLGVSFFFPQTVKISR